MFQLDLFAPLLPSFEIDHRVANIGERLITRLTEKRPGLIIHRVMHPDTFAEKVPNLSDRTTWKDPLMSAVTVNNKRIKMFQEKPKCACCGRTVDVYTVEQVDAEGSKPYINAYSVSAAGIHEMTVDHIVPKGFCGSDSVVNRVTKCRPCNHDKAVLMTLSEIQMVSADIKRYTKEWANPDFVKTALEFQEFIHTLTDHRTRKRAIGILNTCAQSTSMRTKGESYKKRIKQMTNYMNMVNPPAPAPVVVPKLSWIRRLWLFSYDLLIYCPK